MLSFYPFLNDLGSSSHTPVFLDVLYFFFNFFPSFLLSFLHSLLGSFALADVPPQEEEEEEGFLALIPDLMS